MHLFIAGGGGGGGDLNNASNGRRSNFLIYTNHLNLVIH
jgi:hypothetical protein